MSANATDKANIDITSVKKCIHLQHPVYNRQKNTKPFQVAPKTRSTQKKTFTKNTIVSKQETLTEPLIVAKLFSLEVNIWTSLAICMRPGADD